MMPPKIPASPPCRVINFSLENRFRLITSRAIAFDGRKIRLIHQSRARYSYSLSHHLQGFLAPSHVGIAGFLNHQQYHPGKNVAKTMRPNLLVLHRPLIRPLQKSYTIVWDVLKHPIVRCFF